MTKSTITREQVVALIAEHSYDSALVDALEHLLSAMDSEPVEMPLDYLQGHKDGLEWASQLAEANHPETGDWIYDDPIELAKAIRKGPDMPPVQPVADSEPVAEITEDLGRLFVKIHYPTTLKAGDKLYRHAQPAPVVEREPIAWLNDAYLARGVVDGEVGSEDAGPGYIPVYREAGPQPAPVVPEEKPIPNTLSMYAVDAVAAIAEVKGWNACRAAMLHAGNSPAQSDCCPAQNHVSPEQNGDTPAQSQGWIQVSEQMPPSRHEVLVGCWWGEKPRWCCKWATYIPGHPDAQSSGWLIPGASWTPTHWMQLPAGPQEVKSES